MDVTVPTTQAARKRHTCDLCGGDILPGLEYVRWVCFGDGPWVVGVHPSCRDEASRMDWYSDEWPCAYPLYEYWAANEDDRALEIEARWAAERHRDIVERTALILSDLGHSDREVVDAISVHDDQGFDFPHPDFHLWSCLRLVSGMTVGTRLMWSRQCRKTTEER